MSKTQFVAGQPDVSPYVPESPPPARPYRDLCSTCNHAEICGSRSTPEHPILFCELFEAFVPARATPAAAAAPKPPAGEQGAAEPKGLCVNCEHRHDCTMPRPAGGIWHCEEYS